MYKSKITNKLKTSKGITLIALVVTIIVLLILAGVIVNSIVGEDSIITKAQRAKIANQKATYYEIVSNIILEEKLGKGTTNSDDIFITRLENRLNEENWVAAIYLCDENMVEQEQKENNNLIFIDTTGDIEIIIEVDNENNNAIIREDIPENSENKCKITYDPNNGVGSRKQQSARIGFYAVLNKNEYTREDYEFVGWSKDKYGSEILAEKSRIVIEGDMTLYAIWSKTTVTVTFDINGGTSGTMDELKISSGVKTELPYGRFKKTGYWFWDWNTERDGSGKTYEDEEMVTLYDDITLYAQYHLRDYSIQYNLNKGTITGQRTSYNMETEDFTLPTPTGTVSTFVGWTGSNGTTPQKTVTVPKGTTGTLRYVANWTNTTQPAVGDNIDCISYTFVARTMSGSTLTMSPTDAISWYTMSGQDMYNNNTTYLNNACIALFDSCSQKNQLTIRSAKYSERSSNLIATPTRFYWWAGSFSKAEDGHTIYCVRINGSEYNSHGYWIYRSDGTDRSISCGLFPIVSFDKSLLVPNADNSWRLE